MELGFLQFGLGGKWWNEQRKLEADGKVTSPDSLLRGIRIGLAD
jgi:hypothetical protein